MIPEDCSACENIRCKYQKRSESGHVSLCARSPLIVPSQLFVANCPPTPLISDRS